VQRFAPDAESVVDVDDVAASPGGFAAVITTEGRLDGVSSVLGGRFGSPPRELASCDPAPAIGFREGVDIAGASALLACDDRSMLLEFDGGRAPQEVGRAGEDGVRLAGRLVAWTEGDLENTRVVVEEAATGRRVRTFHLRTVDGFLDDFDLRGDGALAISYQPVRKAEGVVIAAVSPRGRVRRVNVPPGPYAAVRIRGCASPICGLRGASTSRSASSGPGTGRGRSGAGSEEVATMTSTSTAGASAGAAAEEAGRGCTSPRYRADLESLSP
jgi:hypothetical protein